MMRKFIILFLITLFGVRSNCQTHFIIVDYPAYTPDSTDIYIAGNFNNWNPGDTNFILVSNLEGNPEIVLNFSAGTSIEYKFTLGSWATVEKGQQGEEIANRVYSFSETEDTVLITIYNWAGIENPDVQHTYADNVIILTDSFYMPQLRRYRRIWLYLPPDYDTTERRYPVIYMHDGQNLFDDATSFAGEWKVDEHLNSLFSQGYSVPIVIGIDNGGSHRIDELTPYQNSVYGGGEGEEYVRFIIETLKPYIDSSYRTLSDRENTWIWGSSLGGLISFYAAMKFNNVFSKVCAFSPSFWINDPQIYTLAEETSLQEPTFIYFLAGGQEGADMEEDCRRMMDILQNNGLSSNYINLKVDPYGQHNEAFWSRNFQEAYMWLSLIAPESIDTINSLNYNIYPVPARDYLLIDTQKYNSSFLCQIIDTRGRIRLSLNCKGNTQLDISSLSSGIYYIIFKSDDVVIVKHFVKL